MKQSRYEQHLEREREMQKLSSYMYTVCFLNNSSKTSLGADWVKSYVLISRHKFRKLSRAWLYLKFDNTKLISHKITYAVFGWCSAWLRFSTVSVGQQMLFFHGIGSTSCCFLVETATCLSCTVVWMQAKIVVKTCIQATMLQPLHTPLLPLS